MIRYAELSTIGLIDRAKNGDNRAFEELVCACDGHACQVAYAILSDHDSVDEAIQQARIDAWLHLKDYQSDIGEFRDWYLGIVRNRCRRVHKKRQRSSVAVSLDEIDDVLISPLEQIIQTEDALERERQKGFVLGALAALPPVQAQVIRLRFIEGKTAQEIAGLRGCAVRRVNRSIATGLRNLRTRLKNGFPLEWDWRQRGGAAP